jgi:hypothetical protein
MGKTRLHFSCTADTNFADFQKELLIKAASAISENLFIDSSKFPKDVICQLNELTSSIKELD